MLFKRELLSKDHSTAFICLLLIAFGYYALVNDYSFFKTHKVKSSKTASIGKITIVKSDARLRSSKNVLWSNAQLEDFIAHGDSLFVGADSKIEVSFNDGKSITIGSNSLVKFNTENQKIKLNLEYGSLKSQNLPTQLVVDDCGQALNIQSTEGDLEIGKTNNCGKVKVKSTKGRIKLNNKVLSQVAVQETIVIAPPPTVALVEKPQMNTDIIKLQEEKAAAYQEAELKAEEQRLAKLAEKHKDFIPAAQMPEVTNNSNLEKDLNTESVPKENTIITPEEPLRTITNFPISEEQPSSETVEPIEKNQPPATAVEVKPLPAPELKKLNIKVDVTSHHSSIVKWNTIEEADEYEVQMSHDQSFDEFETLKTTATESVIKNTGEDKLYVRVRSLSFDDRVSEFSQPASIEYSYPDISLKNKTQNFNYYAQNASDLGQKKDFTISWNDIPHAQKYVVEFDSDSRFQKPQKIITRSPSSTLTIPSQGKYNYRIQALNAKNRLISSSSEIGEIIYNRIFDVKPPIIEKSYQVMTYFFQKGLGKYIWLKWINDSVEKPKYRIDISRDAEFKTLFKSYYSPKNKFLLQEELTSGLYYWRVRTEVVNQGQQQYSDWSTPASIEITTGQ